MRHAERGCTASDSAGSVLFCADDDDAAGLGLLAWPYVAVVGHYIPFYFIFWAGSGMGLFCFDRPRFR